MLRKSQLGQLAMQSDAFLWCTGIEDTFITAPHPKTGRALDEYELTGHYRLWKEDLQLMADLGVRAARYGVPWHRINPAPGKWDWEFADKTLSRLLNLGIDPIVDLVHYGLPAWIEGSFLNPDFPEHMAEYASRLAGRFRGSIRLYTPLNEPRVTAWYCGKLGWWPPFRKGWRGFISILMAVSKGIVRTVEALEQIDSEIVPVHVDATDLYETSDPALDAEAFRRQEIVFLSLDLISGRVNEGHALVDWLLKQGVAEGELRWFQEHAVELPLIGINLYPMFSRKQLLRSRHGLRTRMSYADASIIDRLAQLYHERYQAPLFISETASVGSVARRRAWLDDSIEAVRRVRAGGIPLMGYTWWPMFALVTWAYRQGAHPPEYYLKQMGLWDIDASSAHLPRRETPLVAAYRNLIKSGCGAVGPVANSATELAYVS